MGQVEPLETVVKRYRQEGRTVREAVAEHNRQLIEQQRETEDRILVTATMPGASTYAKEVAQQIIDCRQSGHYTTLG